MNPLRTVFYVASELVVPGGSNLVGGRVGWGLGFFVAGSAAGSVVGLPGIALVSVASLTKASRSARRDAAQRDATGPRPRTTGGTIDVVAKPRMTESPAEATTAAAPPSDGTRLTIVSGAGEAAQPTERPTGPRARQHATSARTRAQKRSQAPTKRRDITAEAAALAEGDTNADTAPTIQPSNPTVDVVDVPAAPGDPRIPPAANSEPAQSSDDRAVIRAWARSKGLRVSVHGPIPNSVIEAYRAGQASTAEQAPSVDATGVGETGVDATGAASTAKDGDHRNPS